MLASKHAPSDVKDVSLVALVEQSTPCDSVQNRDTYYWSEVGMNNCMLNNFANNAYRNNFDGNNNYARLFSKQF